MSNDQFLKDTKQFHRQQAALDRMDALRDELLAAAGEHLCICEPEYYGRFSAVLILTTTDDKPEVLCRIGKALDSLFVAEMPTDHERPLHNEADAKALVRALSNPHTQDLLLGRVFRNLEK